MKLQPVIPFEPIVAEQLPVGDQWIAQIKWDGVRMLSYYDGNRSELINRRGNHRTGFILHGQLARTSMTDIMKLPFVIIQPEKQCIYDTVTECNATGYSCNVGNNLAFLPALVFSSRSVSAVDVLADYSLQVLALSSGEQFDRVGIAGYALNM